MRDVEINKIIDEVMEGNRDAFRKVLHHYGLPLRSYIAAHIHALDDIDDLAQDVFLTAYRQLAEFRRDDDFGAWLRGIARNNLHHYYRSATRRNRMIARFRDDVIRVVEERLERAVSTDTAGSIEILLNCIGKLPVRMRQVVRAGLDGNKPADLAVELTTSVGAVYRLHARANHLLRDCVSKEMG